jgi:hypothetical protein
VQTRTLDNVSVYSLGASDRLVVGPGGVLTATGIASHAVSMAAGADLVVMGTLISTRSWAVDAVANHQISVTGSGDDRFVYGPGDLGAARDQIVDFSVAPGEDDRIDLSAIDAGAAPGDQALIYRGGAAFTAGGAGEVRHVVLGGSTFVQVDANGDGTTDLTIRLVGAPVLTAGDFVP